MKKKLESELISIAHKILKLKGKEDVFKMHTEVAALYEKISVLKFAYENHEGEIPTIGNNSSFFGMLDEAFNNTISDTIEVEDKIYINVDDVREDEIIEPLMNKIKDMVSYMPEGVDTISAIKDSKNDLQDLIEGFKETPIFDPVIKTEKPNTKQTLNDKLKTNKFNIGLNDKIAFIKHLFNNNTEDYNRVISQLNTLETYNQACSFIENMVKPDYKNWEDKQEFEDRFLQIIESKFN